MAICPCRDSLHGELSLGEIVSGPNRCPDSLLGRMFNSIGDVAGVCLLSGDFVRSTGMLTCCFRLPLVSVEDAGSLFIEFATDDVVHWAASE